MEHHVEDLLLGVPPEGGQPRQQDVEQDTQRPDVGCRQEEAGREGRARLCASKGRQAGRRRQAGQARPSALVEEEAGKGQAGLESRMQQAGKADLLTAMAHRSGRL